MGGNQSSMEKEKLRRHSTTLHDHDYYGPLIDSYVKSILKSGLLLDEDLEVLLNVSEFKNFPVQGNYKPSVHVITSFVSLLASLVLAKKCHMPLLIVLPGIFVAKSILAEFKNVYRRKNNVVVVDKLIELINRIRKLNLSIIRYMKTRSDLEKNRNTTLFKLDSTNIKEFFKLLRKYEYNLFQFVMDSLKDISLYSDDLSDDYKCLTSLNPLTILEDADNGENDLVFIQNIQDLHVLFSSKLLSYIGIVCFSEVSTLCVKDFNKLVNKDLSNISKYLQHHHDVIKRQFVALRNSVNKKSEYKLHAKAKTSNTQLVMKLQETLVYSVNNLSIILEKSQSVLDRLENTEHIELKEIDCAITDLRNHTFATYESLDILCKLYGILSNSNAAKQIENKITDPLKMTNDLEQKPTKIVNYDDNIEPLEERFELYIDKEDLNRECPMTKYEEDSSGEYLSLMLQELRQSIKQHQRFIDAKKRRGSEDDEQVINEDTYIELRKSPPKFNLSVLKDGPSKIKVTESPPPVLHLEKEKHDLTLTLPVPPPPPPPPSLPSFNLNNLEEESGQMNARSMLDNIKVLSSQRNVLEDVFGDSDVDSSSADDD